MNIGLLLILIVACAYLAAHWAAERLARRHLIVSGAEYVLLGVLLGPNVSGVIHATTTGPFAPLLTLAFGWVGALVGAQFRLRDLVRLEGRHFSVAFTEAALALAATMGVMAAGCVLWLGLDLRDAWIPALAMGAVAVSSAPTGVALAARNLGNRGFLVRQLQVTTAIDALTAVATIGVLLAVAHYAPPGEGRAPTATEWGVITVAIGLVGGALFHLFVGTERQIDRLFIALAGALILTSGAAAYLRLSPICTTFLVGFVLANTSPSRERIVEVLSSVERPLYFVLLIFAGSAWTPARGSLLAFAFVLVGVRLAAKIGSARLAARVHGLLPALGPHWGRGLVGQGGLAVAIALSYRVNVTAPLSEVIFTAALVSMLLTDVLSARLARDLLVRPVPTPGPAPAHVAAPDAGASP